VNKSNADADASPRQVRQRTSSWPTGSAPRVTESCSASSTIPGFFRREFPRRVRAAQAAWQNLALLAWTIGGTQVIAMPRRVLLGSLSLEAGKESR